MKIFVSSDHAGFGFKEKLIPFLKELGHEVEDKGPFEYNEEDDYPDFIIPVAPAKGRVWRPTSSEMSAPRFITVEGNAWSRRKTNLSSKFLGQIMMPIYFH